MIITRTVAVFDIRSGSLNLGECDRMRRFPEDASDKALGKALFSLNINRIFSGVDITFFLEKAALQYANSSLMA